MPQRSNTVSPRLQLRIEKPEYKVYRTIDKKAEREELGKIYTDQEARIMAREDDHSKLRLLHKQAWEDYEVMRSECIRRLLEVTRHQEKSRQASDDHSTESACVHLEHCDQDKLRARLMEHIVDAAREPRRTMDKRFEQDWTASIVQDHCMAK